MKEGTTSMVDMQPATRIDIIFMKVDIQHGRKGESLSVKEKGKFKL